MEEKNVRPEEDFPSDLKSEFLLDCDREDDEREEEECLIQHHQEEEEELVVGDSDDGLSQEGTRMIKLKTAGRKGREEKEEEGKEEGTRSVSTPRLRLEAAQTLAGKVGKDIHSPSEANLMEEIFKGGRNSVHSAESEVENRKALEDMDLAISNLKSWRLKSETDYKEGSYHGSGENSDDEIECSDDEDDKNYKKLREELSKEYIRCVDDVNKMQLTARLANKNKLDALAKLLKQSSLESEDAAIDYSSVSESELLFRRIEQEIYADNSIRAAEEKVSLESSSLESDMGKLEAQLRGYGQELDHLLQDPPVGDTNDDSVRLEE